MFEEIRRRNVLRVAIAYLAASWLLIQVAETLFPLFGLSAALIRLVVIVLTIGFPLGLVFSWFYEVTPAGIKLERDVDHSRSEDYRARKKFDRIIVGVLVLALAYFALDKFVLDPARDIEREEEIAIQARTEALTAAFAEESIVVLPFVNESDDEDSDYFSDGMAEELLNLLAQVPRLRVISRSSAFSFRDIDIGIPEIARRLNVGHVLQGSALKYGDRVRITAQLIDAQAETNLWSETYDGTLEGVFAIQDKISAAVVDKLEIAMLDDVPTAQEIDSEAYALYLQARYLANQFTADSMARAVELYQQALEIDQDYARAWSGLGWVYANQVNFGHRTADEALGLAREATFTALAIDPDSARAARAYANVGWIAMNFDNDLELAARHYSRALILNPNEAGIVNGAAVLTEVLGRPEDAVAYYEYSIARDPVDANRHTNLAAAYMSAGFVDEAISSLRTVLSLSPDRIGANYLLGVAQLLKGDAQAALQSFEGEVDDEWRVKGSALALHDLGRAAEFDAAFLELKSTWGEQWPAEVAQVYAWIGDADMAFEWLYKAVEKGEAGLMEEWLSPLYGKVHGDQRWFAFLQEIGKTPAQLERIEFEVVLPK